MLGPQFGHCHAQTGCLPLCSCSSCSCCVGLGLSMLGCRFSRLQQQGVLVRLAAEALGSAASDTGCAVRQGDSTQCHKQVMVRVRYLLRRLRFLQPCRLGHTDPSTG